MRQSHLTLLYGRYYVAVPRRETVHLLNWQVGMPVTWKLLDNFNLTCQLGSATPQNDNYIKSYGQTWLLPIPESLIQQLCWTRRDTYTLELTNNQIRLILTKNSGFRTVTLPPERIQEFLGTDSLPHSVIVLTNAGWVQLPIPLQLGVSMTSEPAMSDKELEEFLS